MSTIDLNFNLTEEHELLKNDVDLDELNRLLNNDRIFMKYKNNNNL